LTIKAKIAATAAAAVIGASGLTLIKVSEGRRLQTYIDPVGIPTVCYGHTGPDVRLGQRYTPEQCDAILLKDIKVHRDGVMRCTRVPLNQNQSDAVVSLAFNIGVSRYCNSTLARKLNAGDYAGAANEFPKWTYAGGQQLPGLVTRREAERRLFLTPPTATR
jgi:lysozyme